MGHVALSLQQRLESLDRALHRSALGLHALGLQRSALGPRSSAHEAVALGLPRQSLKECSALRQSDRPTGLELAGSSSDGRPD